MMSLYFFLMYSVFKSFLVVVIFQMSNVFVIGSGFSASAGLPTLVNLFPEMMNPSNERGGENDIENIKKALLVLYPHFDDTSDSYPPFEEYLSLASIMNDFNQTPNAASYIGSLRLLRDCLCNKAQLANESTHLIKPIKALVNNLKPGDTIITFNWDALIETLLYENKLEFNYIGGNESSINILKLHGSLSWINLRSDLSIMHPDLFFRLSENENIYSTNDYSYVDTFDSLDEAPYIVPPISNKTPLESEFLRNLWYKAYATLSEADKIVSIGYSLPQNDLHARALMVNGCKSKEITIVDPDPSVAERYYSSVTPKLNYMQRRYDGSELIDILQ